ncbi:MAG: aminofutalosine deaminase family hydrolase [Helicobacter sp.]|nr:aminofutalosine deaminase family hydrolase [Helicobacter sp.]
MQILGASRVFLCDNDFNVAKDFGVVFDSKILEVGNYKELCLKYKNAKASFFDNSILMPSFSNPHIHFEFSGNNGTLELGDFGIWLRSVMKNRDYLMRHCEIHIERAIKEQLKSGVSAVGAISSYGLDIKLLAKSPLKVVLFNEILGSKEELIDTLFSNFIARFEESKSFESPNFKPALAIHSPYSVHPKLAKKVLDLESNALISTHFLESSHERVFLDKNIGFFNSFYKDFLNLKKPFYSADSFLDLFSSHKKVLFAHCLFANEAEFKRIFEMGFCISCPKSNKLLSNKMLEPSRLNTNKMGIATDGKSSNNNLDFLDELRIALFASNQDIATRANELILQATKINANALDLNSGEIKEGMDADFCIFNLDCVDVQNLALHFILYAKAPHKMYINGKEIEDINN